MQTRIGTAAMALYVLGCVLKMVCGSDPSAQMAWTESSGLEHSLAVAPLAEHTLHSRLRLLLGLLAWYGVSMFGASGCDEKQMWCSRLGERREVIVTQSRSFENERSPHTVSSRRMSPSNLSGSQQGTTRE